MVRTLSIAAVSLALLATPVLAAGKTARVSAQPIVVSASSTERRDAFCATRADLVFVMAKSRDAGMLLSAMLQTIPSGALAGEVEADQRKMAIAVYGLPGKSPASLQRFVELACFESFQK
jgi:hypothetical protein